jgi:mono/diheme cytochrome c family protein
MHRLLSAASCALILACGPRDQSAPGASGDCDAAAQHIASCHGEEVATAFAQNCTPQAASDALADKCGTLEEGKADSLSTQILSPPERHFKYGSIGADKLGIPVALLHAIPIVCSDLLPPGADPRNRPFEAFGLIYESGQDLPIGFSRRRVPLVGIELVGNTCSACHTSTVRESPSAPPSVYFGAPAVRFDVEAYNNFLLGCIGDSSRFNSKNLNAAFDELGVYGFSRFLAYKSSFFRLFVANLEDQVASVVRDGPWGPGRDDAIGLSAAILLGPEFVPPVAAPVDFPSVWNQDARAGQALHWDGASGSAEERNILVAVGAGTPKHGVPLASIAAIQRYLEKLEPPAYPFNVDATLAAAGKPIFEQRCQSCHSEGGGRLWEVVDIAEIGTDPNRLDVVTEAGIAETNALWGYGWEFSQFSKTSGYVNSLLDGIWLRAPYLHNGSVPTLRDLLKPAAERPTSFYRGNDSYDQKDVGFVSTVATEGARSYTLIETWKQGNGSGGHEYGTDLSEADTDALLEYLKTL